MNLGGHKHSDPLEKEMAIHSINIQIPWRRKWQSTPIFLPGKFHGQRSPEGYSLWGRKDLDTTEHAHMHERMHACTQTFQATAVNQQWLGWESQF